MSTATNVTRELERRRVQRASAKAKQQPQAVSAPSPEPSDMLPLQIMIQLTVDGEMKQQITLPPGQAKRPGPNEGMSVAVGLDGRQLLAMLQQIVWPAAGVAPSKLVPWRPGMP